MMHETNGISLPPLSNYQVGKTLGVGGFGKVKEATHVLTGIRVAIKILRRQSIDEEKVRREIKIMRLLSHPHIVKLFEVIETQKKLYLIMEYMNGGELFDYIAGSRLGEDQARRFFQQIISGVESCHLNKVVHRDLKPENLLLDSNGNVKVADFGLANVMRDGHLLKTWCGTPNYASPEVVSMQPYAGPAVDVWSCGVVLYALLSGSLPFDDGMMPVLFEKIKSGIFTFPNHVSLGAHDLIKRMLTVDPVKRITIPEIYKHPWFQVALPQYIADRSLNTSCNARKVLKLFGLSFTSFSALPSDGTDRRDIDARPVFPDQGKWVLGFESYCSSPQETMRYVLTIFKKLNIQCKNIGAYNVECLWKPSVQRSSLPNGMNRLTLREDKCVNETFSLCDVVKFEIQLYKGSGESSYVLDWKRVYGAPFLFIEVCAAFRACVVA